MPIRRELSKPSGTLEGSRRGTKQQGMRNAHLSQKSLNITGQRFEGLGP